MYIRNRGFTLIELMVVLTLIGLLIAIALPSYRQYVLRSNRTAAQAQMMDIANREQQFLLANRVYASKSALEDSGYSLPADVASAYSYDITVGTDAVPSFTITFTATDRQSDDGDLTLDSQGVKTPADKW